MIALIGSRADRTRGDEGRGRHAQGGDAGTRRQERADRLPRRRSRRGRRRRHRRHEFHLVRAIVRLDQPRLHPRENLQRRARQGESQGQPLQAGQPDRSRHHHGLDHHQGAVRARARFHRIGKAGRRSPALRRRPAERSGAGKGLLHRADDLRRRAPRHAHRARGNFRARAVDLQMDRRSQNAGAGQLRGIRPHRLDLDQRPLHRPPHRGDGAGRLHLDQRGVQSISSARRSAATSKAASGARNVSRRCSPTRRRRIST